MNETTYIAAYMPYTGEGKDPSKGGFKTEDEAWDWIIENGICEFCKDSLDDDGFAPCTGEWMVFDENEEEE